MVIQKLGLDPNPEYVNSEILELTKKEMLKKIYSLSNYTEELPAKGFRY